MHNIKESVANNSTVNNTKEVISNLKEKIVNNNSIDRAKETVHNIKESVANTPLLHKSINYAPTPAPVMVHNNKTIAPVHHHNSNYSMNVMGGTTAQETAYAVQEQIIDSKAIEMANVNRVVPAYKDM